VLVGATIKTGFELDLLHLTHSHSSGLQVIQRYRSYTLFIQFTVTHTHYVSQFSLVVSWQRMYNSLTITSDHAWSIFSLSNSFPAIILQLTIPKTRLHSIPLLPNSFAGRLTSRNFSLHFTASATLRGSVFCVLLQPLRKDHRITASILKEACLLVRYLAIDVIFRTFASAGMCLAIRCLAMGLHVTIYFYVAI
jgi:hypothetical protein